MKCPKCGYTSFDDLDSCKKCSNDLREVRPRSGLRAPLGGVRQQPTPPPQPPAAKLLPKDEKQDRPSLDVARRQPVSPGASSVGTVKSPQIAVENLPELPPLPSAAAAPGLAQETPAWPGLATTSREEAGRLESWLALEGQARHFPVPQVVTAPPNPELACDEEPAGESPGFSQGTEAVSVGLRLLASLLDLGVISLLFGLFVLAGSWVLPGAVGEAWFSVAALLNRASPYFLVLFALCFGYFTVFHALLGQTPGKILTGLGIVDEQGLPLTLAQAFLRSAGGLLCLLPVGLGFIWIAFAGEHLGWNDRLAGTRVVRSRPEPAPAEPAAAEGMAGDA